MFYICVFYQEIQQRHTKRHIHKMAMDTFKHMDTTRIFLSSPLKTVLMHFKITVKSR